MLVLSNVSERAPSTEKIRRQVAWILREKHEKRLGRPAGHY